MNLHKILTQEETCASFWYKILAHVSSLGYNCPTTLLLQIKAVPKCEPCRLLGKNCLTITIAHSLLLNQQRHHH